MAMNPPASDQYRDTDLPAGKPTGHAVGTNPFAPPPPPPSKPATASSALANESMPRPAPTTGSAPTGAASGILTDARAKNNSEEKTDSLAQGEAADTAGPAWFRQPITSLNIDGAVRAVLPKETADLLFWQQPIGSGVALATLLLAPTLIFAMLSSSRLAILCAVAEWMVIGLVAAGLGFRIFDKLFLKHDPPRNLIDVYLMPYLQQTQHAIAAMLPTREQFLWSIDSSLQQAQFGWRTFVNMCYRADWATALPVIAALHGARILLRNISLSLLYYSGLILLFSVPMAYARYKPTIDAMVCSKLELVRSITVRQLDNLQGVMPHFGSHRQATDKNKHE